MNRIYIPRASALAACLILGLVSTACSGEQKERSEKEGVEIKTYSVIYDAINDVEPSEIKFYQLFQMNYLLEY